MFTGLIEEIGTIKSINDLGGGKRIAVNAKHIMDDLNIDDSVAIQGVCLTVVSYDEKSFELEAVEETFRKTTMGHLKSRDEVNLERAMKLGGRLGGHLVQGHVDTIGKVKQIIPERTGILVWISFKEEYSKYIVPVGSICVDGVSLTVAEVTGNSFKISVIPHTWSVTTLKDLKIGSSVNLEFDIIGKYVEKMLGGKHQASSGLEKYIDQPDW